MDDETIETPRETVLARLRSCIPSLMRGYDGAGGATKIAMIKMVRTLIPGIGLKEAKDFVEAAMEGNEAKLVAGGRLVFVPEMREVYYISDDHYSERFRICFKRYEEDCDYAVTVWDFSQVNGSVASDAVKICKDRWGF